MVCVALERAATRRIVWGFSQATAGVLLDNYSTKTPIILNSKKYLIYRA
jgi:hypothetical protein